MKFVYHIYHLAISDVWTIFLKGNSQNQNSAVLHLAVILNHQLHHLLGYIIAHAVVHTSSCEDNLRIIAFFNRFLRQVIRIYANAVPADQAGGELYKIPFGSSSL